MASKSTVSTPMSTIVLETFMWTSVPANYSLLTAVGVVSHQFKIMLQSSGPRAARVQVLVELLLPLGEPEIANYLPLITG